MRLGGRGRYGGGWGKGGVSVNEPITKKAHRDYLGGRREGKGGGRESRKGVEHSNVIHFGKQKDLITQGGEYVQTQMLQMTQIMVIEKLSQIIHLKRTSIDATEHRDEGHKYTKIVEVVIVKCNVWCGNTCR